MILYACKPQMKIFDYKKLTKEELEKIFSDFPFKIQPMWHQMVSLSFSADRERVVFLHGVGTGKTLTSLWTTQLWDNKKILVICPSSAFSAWERDISQYMDCSFEFLTGSGRDRKSKIRKKKDIFIINYEGLKTIFCDLIKGRGGWKINYKYFIHHFDCIIFDEVHKCKNYKSLQSKICYQLSKMAKNVIGLTGTAVDSSLLEVFNIYKVIDLGKSLGNNFFLYRMNYFKPSVYDWIIKPGAEKEILGKLTKSTLSFQREECFDLPEIQEIVRIVEPSKEFLDLQKKIVDGEDLILNGVKIKTDTNSTNELEISRFRKIRSLFLRELPSGFLYYKEGERKSYQLKKNSKIESLLDLIEDTSGKVIVFYHFTEEANLIEKSLNEMNYKFISIKGGQSAEERTSQIKKFTNDKTVKCAVVQQSAGSEGWDGSVANVAIFYSIVASPKTRKQCIGRIHRMGQKNSCLVIDLVLKRSIDGRVLKNRCERFNFVQETMEYIREFGGVEEL